MSNPEPAEARAQRQLSAAVRQFAAEASRSPGLLEFRPSESLTQTEIVVTVSALMRAARLEAFELSMWQAFAEGDRRR